jgi:hypothetical protein
VLQSPQRKNEMMFIKIYNLKWNPNLKIRLTLNDSKNMSETITFFFNEKNQLLKWRKMRAQTSLLWNRGPTHHYLKINGNGLKTFFAH